MSKIVLFNRPLYFVKETIEGVRKIVEVYGFKLYHYIPYRSEGNIDEYIDLLCGVSKWESEGNHIDYTTWISDTGKTYEQNDWFIKRYIRNAKRHSHITWKLYETDKTLDKGTPGMLDGDFIISQDLYHKISEYGATVEKKQE